MATDTNTPSTTQQAPARARALVSRPTPEVFREYLRLREAVRQNGDEASRQAVLAFAKLHGIGAGAGTLL
jgi:hypothetical protein